MYVQRSVCVYVKRKHASNNVYESIMNEIPAKQHNSRLHRDDDISTTSAWHKTTGEIFMKRSFSKVLSVDVIFWSFNVEMAMYKKCDEICNFSFSPSFYVIYVQTLEYKRDE